MTLRPEEPGDAGVEDRTPDESHLEGAHVLADQARERLEEAGFTPREILEWAEDFIAYEGSGDVEAFLEWITERERYPNLGAEDGSGTPRPAS